MKIKILLVALVTILLEFIAFAYTVEKGNGQNSGTVVATLKDVYVQLPVRFAPPGMNLGISAVRSADNKLSYIVTAEYESVDKVWIEIPRGETFTWFIDDKKVTLSGEGSTGNRFFHSSSGKDYIDLASLDDKERKNIVTAKETAKYPVSIDILKRIASAKKVKFRVHGTETVLVYTLTDSAIADIGRFINEYHD